MCLLRDLHFTLPSQIPARQRTSVYIGSTTQLLHTRSMTGCVILLTDFSHTLLVLNTSLSCNVCDVEANIRLHKSVQLAAREKRVSILCWNFTEWLWWISL